MKRAFLALIAFAMSACTDDVAAPLPPAIQSVDIDVISDVLFPGDSTRITPVVQDMNGEYLIDPAIEWSSSDTTVAIVRNSHVIAVRSGTAQVRARFQDSEGVRAIRVGEGFVDIEAGPAATCGLMKGGVVYCWGETRAITDDVANTTVPHRIPTELRFIQISVGSNHTCGVTADQRGYCWGGNNRKGWFGSSDLWDGSSTPLLISGNHRWKEVSAGWEHTCGLTTDGVAYCWGRGYEGQLGDGTLNNTIFRTPVAVKTQLRFKQLQAAGSSTCGLTVAGEAYCWGDRHYLGDSTYTAHQPLPIRVPVPALDVFDSANDDPCGITPAKQLYCWTNKVELVAKAGAVSQVSVGGTHVCFTRLDGAILCYGDNKYGQLGIGNNIAQSTPVAPAGHTFAKISAGAGHTCGVTTNGATYCWGYGYYGQLGNGGRMSTNLPGVVYLSEE
jgi:alpha-tubulin suppressor-like RCC1 family protein